MLFSLMFLHKSNLWAPTTQSLSSCTSQITEEPLISKCQCMEILDSNSSLPCCMLVGFWKRSVPWIVPDCKICVLRPIWTAFGPGSKARWVVLHARPCPSNWNSALCALAESQRGIVQSYLWAQSDGWGGVNTKQVPAARHTVSLQTPALSCALPKGLHSELSSLRYIAFTFLKRVYLSVIILLLLCNYFVLTSLF